MTHNMYIYILITGVVSYIIRVLPLTLIRKPIENKYLQSFLLVSSFSRRPGTRVLEIVYFSTISPF